MPRTDRPLPLHIASSRIMVFIDGENLAIRYERLLANQQPLEHVVYKSGVYAWSTTVNRFGNPTVPFVRRYLYTSLTGSEADRNAACDALIEAGIHAPRVFHRSKRKGSKRVDISLSVEMLTHAHRRNYDVAILVAGDEDYVPLVEAVIAEGRRVILWFFEDTLSPALRRVSDHFFDLRHAFFVNEAEQSFRRDHYY